MFVVQKASIKARDRITWAQATMLMHTNWGSSNESQCKACTQIFQLKDVICKEKFLLFLPTAIPGQWPQSKIGQINTIDRILHTRSPRAIGQPPLYIAETFKPTRQLIFLDLVCLHGGTILEIICPVRHRLFIFNMRLFIPMMNQFRVQETTEVLD